MLLNRNLKITIGYYFGFWIGLSFGALSLDYYHKLSFVRGILDTLGSPIIYTVDQPIRLLERSKDLLQDKSHTHQIIQQLQEKQFNLQVQLSHAQFLVEENQALKALFKNTMHLKEHYITLAYLSHIKHTTSYKSEYYINRGFKQGLKIGHVVLDTQGVIGHIIEVKANTSLVLKLDDPRHAVPVELVRNGLRGILKGTGAAQLCEVDYVAKTSDVQVGDHLMTSGVGGKYPRGYPIASITAVENSPSCDYLKVSAAPVAALTNTSLFLVLGMREVG